MSSKKNTNSFLGKVILFLNSLVVFVLILIYIGWKISPEIFWPIAFIGLTYPVVLFLNVMFVIIWILRGKFYFLISLLTILLGYGHVKNFVQWNNITRDLPENGVNIHILSYNVRVFDLYNYGPNWQPNFTNRDNIYGFLEQNDFDIICFQEFVHDETGAFKTLDTLPGILNASYTHTGFSKVSRNVNYFGLATFTRFPIVNKGKIEFPNRTGNQCIYTDIIVHQDTIRVYNVHFESIGLSPEDYLFVENITNVEQIADRNALRTGGLQILKRLKRAFQQRAMQVNLVAEHMENSPYPIILAGDFNDTPTSYAYQRINRNLSDAFRSGRGIGQTYMGNLPSFRIDYIFHSKDFSSYNFTTGSERYSDHYPISVWLNYDPQNRNTMKQVK